MKAALITDEMVETALRTLATTAQETAAARAIRLRAEFRRKRVRARLLLASNEKTSEARVAWAESQDDYRSACDDEADAVERDERLRAERSDAAIIIEAWRTEQASNRAGSNFK